MHRRTRFIMVVGLLAFSLVGCSGRETASTPESDSTVSTIFTNVVTASGKVVPVQWATLSFETGGRVVWLAAEGKQVVAGEPLARLDATNPEYAVAQARAALATTQAQLAATKAGATAEDIAAAEGSVLAAQGGLSAAEAAQTQAQLGAEIARAQLRQAEEVVVAAEAALLQAQGALDVAEADLASAEARLAQVRAGASEEEVRIAQLDEEAARVRLAQLQDSPDEKAIEMARLSWEIARTSLWQAQLERDAIQAQSVPNYQKELAKAAVGAAESAARISELEYQQAQEGTGDEEVRLAQIAVSQAEARLARLASTTKEDLAVAQAAVDAARARVQTAEAGQDAAEAALAQAQAALEAAQGQVAQAEAGVTAAQAQVKVAEGQLAQAEAQRDRLKVGATAEEIAVLEAQVAQAEAALAQAESALAKATLVAPFAGTIGTVYLREGEVIPPNTPLLMLGDVGALRVETTDLNEVDAARVGVGSVVTLTFDALPGQAARGQVARLAPMASVSQGGTNFTAIVEMDSPPEALRWGMTAFVDIEVD